MTTDDPRAARPAGSGADEPATRVTGASPAAAGVPPAADPGGFPETGERRLLGGYRLLRRLGAGGMGVVFLAEDIALGRLAALKVLGVDWSKDAEARTRFLREAQAAASVRSDHVVTIFQVGVDGEIPFLAMELLDGEPLDARLGRIETLPAREVAHVGCEAARGLSAVHEKGFVHRDVKPANLWIESGSGRIKLLDFGLARTIKAEDSITRSGWIMGTPSYMSPEQLRGDPLDGRSDLFSLGCVLFRAAVGEIPRGGLGGSALGEASPARIVAWLSGAGLPSALSDLVAKLLAADAADRPATAHAVAEALAAFDLRTPGGRRAGTTTLASVAIPHQREQAEAPRAGERTPAEPSASRERIGPSTRPGSEAYLSQLRLLLEEVTCDLCRFEWVLRDQVPPETIRIDREAPLGPVGTFADLRVAIPGRTPFFVEVKYGYSNERLAASLRRKYGRDAAGALGADRVLLLVDTVGRTDWPRMRQELEAILAPRLVLEVWDEAAFLPLLRDRFGVDIPGISESDLLDVREAIDRAKGFHAFGGADFDDYRPDPLEANLLWHFGFWRLRQLRDSQGLAPREILPPGLYRNVVVLHADLWGFREAVAATRDDEIVRDGLTSFYSKARYQVLNSGGMVLRFREDSVVALFGIPDSRPEAFAQALETARSLGHVAASMANHWRRQVDRELPASGLRASLASGDVQVVPLRPFSRSRFELFGEPFAVAEALLPGAGPDEIVASNSFVRALPETARAGFAELAPIEAAGLGRLRGWKGR